MGGNEGRGWVRNGFCPLAHLVPEFNLIFEIETELANLFGYTYLIGERGVSEVERINCTEFPRS